MEEKEKKILTPEEINLKSTRKLMFICEDCGTVTSTTLGHLLWFFTKGNVVPFRCDECIKRKKERKAENF